MNKRTYSRRGQTLVEYALLLPLLLLIVMVLFDLGRAVYYYSVIFNAAREGARYGIIHPTDTSGIEAAARELAIGLDPTSLSVNVTTPTADTIEVAVTYTYQAVTPLVDQFISGGNTIDLQSHATMHLEQ